MEYRFSFYRILREHVLFKRGMCHILVAAFLSQTFVACAGGLFVSYPRGKKYAYSYKLIRPVASDDLTFRDQNVKMQFSFDESSLHFQMDNVSNSIMVVRWNRVSLGVDNRFSPVRHSVDFYSDTSSISTSVLIPPAGYILETIAPAENIRSEGAHWVERDLFPTTDHGDSATAAAILGNLGKNIVLMMRLQCGDSLVDYRYDFQVASVTEVAWNNYHPPKRNPPAVRRPEAVVADEITTAIVVVGMLGFIAFMVSLHKSPVSE